MTTTIRRRRSATDARHARDAEPCDELWPYGSNAPRHLFVNFVTEGRPVETSSLDRPACAHLLGGNPVTLEVPEGNG